MHCGLKSNSHCQAESLNVPHDSLDSGVTAWQVGTQHHSRAVTRNPARPRLREAPGLALLLALIGRVPCAILLIFAPSFFLLLLHLFCWLSLFFLFNLFWLGHVIFAVFDRIVVFFIYVVSVTFM